MKTYRISILAATPTGNAGIRTTRMIEAPNQDQAINIAIRNLIDRYPRLHCLYICCVTPEPL